jgi:pimeloyl-ACP methyl ester carboxylesterase
MKIAVNNIELFYNKSGSGEPLILLHGNGEDHHIFDVLVKKFEHNFTVYSIDSRNHGESSSSDDFSYESMAQDIFCFISKLQLKNVRLAGFSDGAIIGLILAMKHPECVGKIALLGVNLKPEDFTEESYAFVKETYEMTKDPLFKLMLEQPSIELDEVKAVFIPTLIIAGEQDIFKPETFVKLAQTMPDAKLIIMKDHEHDSYIVNSDILYPDLLEFFAQL